MESTPFKTSNLIPEVVQNFGHPLPEKYQKLLHQFVIMERVIIILNIIT